MENQWPKASLGEKIDVQTGYPFESDRYTEKPGDVRLLRGANISQGRLDWGNEKRWPASEVNEVEEYLVDPGDIILAMDRPWIEAGLKFSRITGHETPCLLVQRVARLTAKENFDQRFLKYVIQHRKFTQYVKSVQTGSAVPHISAKQIRNYEFNCPPLPVQRRIADILGALDDKIELNRRMNETLEEMAQTLYRHWFVDFGPFQDREFKDTEELGPIPEGWETQKVKEFGEVVLGSTPSTKDEENYGSEYPFIKIPDMHGQVFVDETENYLSEKGAQSQHKRFLPADSIVVSCIATPGLVTITSQKSQTNQQINSVVPNDEILREYLYLTFDHQSHRIKRLASGGTATAILNKTDFSNVKLLSPPSSVIESFHEKCSKWFDLMKNNLSENQILAETRDYLLPKLISGEIEVEEAEAAVHS